MRTQRLNVPLRHHLRALAFLGSLNRRIAVSYLSSKHPSLIGPVMIVDRTAALGDYVSVGEYSITFHSAVMDSSREWVTVKPERNAGLTVEVTILSLISSQQERADLLCFLTELLPPHITKGMKASVECTLSENGLTLESFDGRADLPEMERKVGEFTATKGIHHLLAKLFDDRVALREFIQARLGVDGAEYTMRGY